MNTDCLGVSRFLNNADKSAMIKKIERCSLDFCFLVSPKFYFVSGQAVDIDNLATSVDRQRQKYNRWASCKVFMEQDS